MNRFRKIVFWCHLPVGVAAGLVILIMSITGALLSYEKQIVAWADKRTYRVAPPAAGAARLPLDLLLAKVHEARPELSLSTVTLRSEPDAPLALGLGREGTILVDQYRGEILGEGSKTARNFFRVVTDWHRWLGAEGDRRALARAITGASNLGFLFIVASGFYLWWPRKREHVRNTLWFRRGLPAKARDFNWHNVIGIWSSLPLFLVVLSATVISYPWASDLVYRMAGEAPPAQRGPGRPGGQEPREAAVSFAGLEQLLARAEQQMPGWQSINLRLPASANAPAVFTIDRGSGGQPQKRAQLTLDRKSGEVLSWEPFSSYSAGRKLRTFLRFAHTGEVAGLVGQAVAGLVSLGGAVLVYTGLALSWRRFRAWVARRYRPAPIASQVGEGAE